ncbi:Vacuolar protein sorting-associated protein 41-like protein [Acropora cervicornis]|uniref:Vacuolar protein sorting-associated protein 41 homolog n=1 Tax=Acropora cervicornis TaxID=6130 RepID=A0AAD9R0C4_ACRCE|nr:Vacuolar protein sorting-associated protein 41-like protein [Acropora cervicornis]
MAEEGGAKREEIALGNLKAAVANEGNKDVKSDDEEDDEEEFEGSEEEDDEEEVEPKLKYERIGNAMNTILNGEECASCMAVHTKFLALGTHYGVVHILDHQGNPSSSKQYPSHTTAINQISIDQNGDYVASCSDDGRVVINGLCSSENNIQTSFDSPVKSVALDPEFSKKRTKMYVTGGTKLILTERGWFRNKVSVIHEGEGSIRTIKWKSTLIAWANDNGVKVFDLNSQRIITHIKREPGDYRPELYRCCLCWKDDKTLLIGWADIVQICVVKERLLFSQKSDLPPLVVEIVARFKSDYYISGIAYLKNDLVILSYMTNIEAVSSKKARRVVANRPQLRIVSPRGLMEPEEISADALSVRGFEQYRCDDYHLENVAEENLFYIVSPKDLVLAKPRNVDDHIKWLIDHGKYEDALLSAETNNKEVKRHNQQEIGRAYLKSLMEEGKYETAARVCVKVLGDDKKLWEDEVYKFARKHQLEAIAPYIPTNTVKLSSVIYEMVLYDFLKKDYKKFQALIKYWPADLYSVQPIISAVQLHKTNEIRQGTGNIPKEAVKMLINNVDKVSVEDVVRQLSKRSELLHIYLDALFVKDPQAAMDYHELQIPLYAEYDRSKLLTFLRNSNYYPLQKLLKERSVTPMVRTNPMAWMNVINPFTVTYQATALNECEQRHLVPEMVFLLSRMGNNKQALQLIIQEENDVEKAIDFAKEQDDEDLWDDLINYSLDKPEFITGLLQNIGAHVDPIKLIQRIPEGMKIPGLRDSLVKILQDFNLQISLREGCKKILVKDSVSLMQRLSKVQQKGVSADEETKCPVCQGTVIAEDVKSASHVVVFFCKHIYHEDCLPARDVGPFCQICTAHSQVKRLRTRQVERNEALLKKP